ncbi:MAG: protein kinase [Lentisphaeria bacterium]|nr:protein kinase [Lentisphaeria bacterium]
MDNTRFSPGSRLGQYRIIRRIGSGGAGEVYLCRHIVLEKSYALKVIDISSGEAGSEAQGRLLREARIARKIRHRNLVPVIDANVLPDANIAYIVMEYVDGETLDELISTAPLPESAALYVCRCVALVLAEAEKHSIVHRDIKPSNILIDRAGNVKVTDLGIAKIDKSSVRCDEPVTQGEKLLGTPDYASPEQLRDSSSVDIRADIYSLGATLYHMLSGRKPFSGNGVFNLMAQILESNPPEIPGISPATAALVKKMMAKEPSERPQTAGALLSELRKTTISNAGVTSEIKRFLAGGARQLFSEKNIRTLTRLRNIFIILCSIASGLLIFLHIFYRYNPGRESDSIQKYIRKNLDDSRYDKLVAMVENNPGSAYEIIKYIAGHGGERELKRVAENIPQLIREKKYAPAWLDALSGKKQRKTLTSLLAMGFDVNAATAPDRAPAVFRKELFYDVELLELLMKHKLNVLATDDNGRTALIRMARNRRAKIKCAKLLLSAKVPINARDRQQVNAFTAAVNANNPEFARFLVGAGIKLSKEDIENIPDTFNLKYELAPKRKNPEKIPQVKIAAGKTAAAPSNPPQKSQEKVISVSEKESKPQMSSEFASAVSRELENVRQLSEKRRLRRKNHNEAESRKLRRKIEVYLQTEPVKRIAIGEEINFIRSVISQIESGTVDPDIIIGKNRQHLLQAAVDGAIYPRRRIFSALLKAGADPDSIPFPVGDAAMCRELIAHGRSKFAPDDLIEMLFNPEPDWDSAKKMLLRGAGTDAADEEKNNVFHRASALGNVEFLSLLLNSGKPGADAENKSGHTPYRLAVMFGKKEAAELLEKSGYSGRTTVKMRNQGALFNAVESDNPEETAYLMMLDTDPLLRNGKYQNILQCAVENNSINAARILLENGVSPEKYTGTAPVLLALQKKNVDMFTLLMYHGADPQTVVTDRFGRKSLLFTEVFRSFGKEYEKIRDCFAAMLDNNWNWKTPTPDGDTPLTWMEKWNEGNQEIQKLFTE